MCVLLDTHAFLSFVLNDQRLSVPAQNTIANSANEVPVSPAIYGEVAIKVRIRKLILNSPYEGFFRTHIAANNFTILPVEIEHTAILTTLPFHHRDPFDRLLIAQAQSENISLISNDSIVDLYGVSRIW